MPGAAGGMLPPVIAQLLADAGPGIAKVQEFKAILADFASKDYTARIGVEIDPASLAQLAVIGAAGGGGGGGGLLAGAAGGAAAEGGGGVAKATLMGLLWGRGMRIGFLGGLAGLGTVGSFAGFGAEHILMTMLGLAGSAAGGALGGGLLALGGLGTMGVGMGSDMAVAKSTLADTKTLATAYGNLANAVKLYGANSSQASAAQTALNNQIKLLGGAGQVGVAAEMRLAQAAVALGAVWDKVTQQARAAFVYGLALPALQMAQGYLPLIADAATRNFGIMGQAMKPLFAFLAGPGHKIFTDLENVFARDLPIGTGIFVQSLELILRTIDHIATTANFGSFLQRILDFVTKLNTTGFGALMKQVDKLIGLFHIWATFVAVLGRDIVDMFTQATGLGSGIIQSLTEMLQKLGEWERSTQGKAAMHNLFEVHRQEILELLKIIPPLVVAIGSIYLAIAPTMVRIATVILTVVASVLTFITHLQGGLGTVAKWTLGIGLLALKLGLLNGPLGALGGLIGGLAGKVAVAAVQMAVLVARTIAVRAATLIAAAAQALWNLALAANPIGLIIIGIAILIVGLVLLVTHWKQVVQWLGNVVAWVRKTYTEHQALFNIILVLLGPIGLLIKVVATVIDHWKQIVTWVGNVVKGFGGLIAAIGNVIGWLNKLGDIAKTVGNLLNAINPFAKHSPSLVESVLAGTQLIAGYYGTMADRIGSHAARAKGYIGVLSAATNPHMTGFSGGYGGLALAGAGGGSIAIHSAPIINIHGATGNPQQIGTAVQKALDKHTADLVKMLKGGVYLPGQGLP